MHSMARPLPRRRPSWLAACAMAGAGSLAIVTTAAAAPPTIDRQSGSGIFWNAGSPNPTYVITATGGETSLSYTTSESATPVEVPANGVVALPSAPQGARSLTAFPTGLQTSRPRSTLSGHHPAERQHRPGRYRERAGLVPSAPHDPADLHRQPAAGHRLRPLSVDDRRRREHRARQRDRRRGQRRHRIGLAAVRTTTRRSTPRSRLAGACCSASQKPPSAASPSSAGPVVSTRPPAPIATSWSGAPSTTSTGMRGR